MVRYVDLDKIVAEIERRIKINKECMLGLRNLDYYQGKVDAFNDTVSFIDTLEVKEVNLEKSISDWLSDGLPNDEEEIDYIKETAKHFFELGLKSKSPYVCTPNIDDTLKEMGVDPDSKSAESFKEFYYMALEKFKAQKGEEV